MPQKPKLEPQPCRAIPMSIRQLTYELYPVKSAVKPSLDYYDNRGDGGGVSTLLRHRRVGCLSPQQDPWVDHSAEDASENVSGPQEGIVEDEGRDQ